MIDPKNIQLTENELNKCLEFSEISAQNQQKIEFGQKTTSPRKVSEIARDNLIGKIAEVAFCKLLKENYGIDIELDFNYYPRGQWDSQDAEVNGWRIDIKGTRKGGHWLLIEWNKLNFRQRDNNLSHVFVMFSVDWNRNIDAPTGKASFEGIASLNKLNRYTPNTRVLLKGSCIPGHTPVCRQITTAFILIIYLRIWIHLFYGSNHLRPHQLRNTLPIHIRAK